MDHASAHERIADLALEAGGLARLPSSSAEADRALMDHVRGCEACQADITASRNLSDRLRRALAELQATSGFEPIAAPASLRAAVLGAAHREREVGTPPANPARGRDTRPAPAGPGWRDWFGWLRPRWAPGLAAALAIALLGGVAGSQLQRVFSVNDRDSIVAVVATLDRVLAADNHRIVPLRTAAGGPAGSVAWSRQDFAVLASTLHRPAAGSIYRCWLQWAGKSASIGVMDFAGDTAYWTGSVGDWAAVAFDPGAQFIVTLEPSSGPMPPLSPTTPAVLVADLGT